LRLTETHRPKPQELPDAGMYQDGSDGDVNDLSEDHSEVIKVERHVAQHVEHLLDTQQAPDWTVTLDSDTVQVVNDLSIRKRNLESTPVVFDTSVRSNLSLDDEFRRPQLVDLVIWIGPDRESNLSLDDEFRRTPFRLFPAMNIADLLNDPLSMHGIVDADFSSEVYSGALSGCRPTALCLGRKSGPHKLLEGHSPLQKRPYKPNWQPQKSRKLEQKIRHTRGPYRGR